MIPYAQLPPTNSQGLNVKVVNLKPQGAEYRFGSFSIETEGAQLSGAIHASHSSFEIGMQPFSSNVTFEFYTHIGNCEIGTRFIFEPDENAPYLLLLFCPGPAELDAWRRYWYYYFGL